MLLLLIVTLCIGGQLETSLESCLLCEYGIDSKEKILFSFSYSCCVRDGFGISYWAMPTWEEELKKISRRFAGDSDYDKVGRVTWRAIINETWYCRCSRNVGDVGITTEEMISKINIMLQTKRDVPNIRSSFDRLP
ncbi:hypothetical protein LINPERPRIM_LOCUS37368 [Linum perenne]